MKQTIAISANEIIQSRDFSNFLQAARNFCSSIEGQLEESPNQFLSLIQNQLRELYTLGRNIPAVDLQNDIDFDIAIPNEEIQLLFKSLGNKVPFSYYWTVLNPLDKLNLPETGTGDLIDDLGDIYKDLKRGIILFDKPDFGATENAIWNFKFDFENHWSDHCVAAITIIHHFFETMKKC